MLADSLGYHLKTHSLKDNLAMYSRFPLEAIAWREPFKSNPAKITLPNGKLTAGCAMLTARNILAAMLKKVSTPLYGLQKIPYWHYPISETSIPRI